LKCDRRRGQTFTKNFVRATTHNHAKQQELRATNQNVLAGSHFRLRCRHAAASSSLLPRNARPGGAAASARPRHRPQSAQPLRAPAFRAGPRCAAGGAAPSAHPVFLRCHPVNPHLQRQPGHSVLGRPESVPRLRAWLRLLLRTALPRLSRLEQRARVRDQNPRQAPRRRAAPPRARLAQMDAADHRVQRHHRLLPRAGRAPPSRSPSRRSTPGWRENSNRAPRAPSTASAPSACSPTPACPSASMSRPSSPA